MKRDIEVVEVARDTAGMERAREGLRAAAEDLGDATHALLHALTTTDADYIHNARIEAQVALWEYRHMQRVVRGAGGEP